MADKEIVGIVYSVSTEYGVKHPDLYWKDFTGCTCPRCGHAVKILSMKYDNDFNDRDRIKCTECTLEGALHINKDRTSTTLEIN